MAPVAVCHQHTVVTVLAHENEQIPSLVCFPAAQDLHWTGHCQPHREAKPSLTLTQGRASIPSGIGAHCYMHSLLLPHSCWTFCSNLGSFGVKPLCVDNQCEPHHSALIYSPQNQLLLVWARCAPCPWSHWLLVEEGRRHSSVGWSMVLITPRFWG